MSFGSVNRGDNDEFSDRDILVVTPNDPEFDHNIYSHLIKSEYSISYYNYEKLTYLSINGNLFIEHLRKSGEILYDSSKRLSKILDNFKPLESYELKLSGAYKASSMFSTIPSNEIAGGWICDNLYVFIRNILVYKSAVDNSFRFGYKEIIEDYKEELELDISDIDALHEIRITKQKYRDKPHFLKVSNNKIRQYFDVAGKISRQIKYEFMSTSRFDRVVRSRLDDQNLSSYEKLRSLEGLYNCYGNNIEILSDVFSKPQFYIYKAKKERNLLFWYRLISDRKNSPNTAAPPLS